MGTPDFAVAVLRGLFRAGHEILTVVTRPDRPRRRQSSPPEPAPVKREAAALNLPVQEPDAPADPEFVERLRILQPDTIVVVGYGRILPPAILDLPPRWCINLHASILPKYRGAAPIARAIMTGEKVTGVTTIKMDEGLDTGGILLQRECAIGLTETAGELSGRLAALGADLLVETLDRLSRGTLEPHRQDDREASLAPLLSKEDGRIDWSAKAGAIANRIRACNPWPLAFGILKGKAVQILRAEEHFASSRNPGGEPVSGQVIAADDAGVVVQCGEKTLLGLLEIRFPGRRAMSARDAVNGRLILVGETLAQASPG
jgi:methionyl-tRNA formyltransferase